MRRAEDLLPAEEQLRLDECVREPLSAPGSVQPHAALVAADLVTGSVTQASANTAELLGVPVAEVLGRPLEETLGTVAVKAVREAAARRGRLRGSGDHRALRRLDLDQALRRGLQRDEFLLHYQPIVTAAEGRVRGLEVLLRWQRPGTGLVPPDQFIPLAEDTGFIVPLGEWVLDQAVRQLATWAAQGVGEPDLTLSVNLSARQQLDAHLPERVTRAVQEAGIAPERLHLEITESVWMSDRPSANEVVDRPADSGVVLVIDDFGTGYSSLAYLRELPARQLKIDRSSIRRLGGDPRDRSLVAAVVGLAREFDLQSVAEGVETAEQQAAVSALGCDLAQGYLFARPADAATTAAWLLDAAR